MDSPTARSRSHARLTGAAWIAASGLVAALLAVVPWSARSEIARAPTVAGHAARRVVERGREAEVRAFVDPAIELLAPRLRVTEISVRTDVIELRYAPADGANAASCALPEGFLAPATARVSLEEGPSRGDVPASVAGDLRVELRACGLSPDEERSAADRLARALAARPHASIWTHFDGPESRGRGGILSPWLARLRGAPAAWLFAWMAAAIGASLIAARAMREGSRAAPRPPRVGVGAGVGAGGATRTRTRWILSALFVVGVALRALAAARTPMDGDETWAVPSATPVLNSDHDAWVHPPLFRALQRAWVSAIGWTPPSGLVALRALSLLAAIATLLVLFAPALRRARSTLVIVPLAVVAIAPSLWSDSILARPYAVAAALVTLTLVALFGATDHASGRDPGRARWLAAILAAGTAAWCDLLHGLFAIALVLLALVVDVARRRARAWRRVLPALAAIAVFVLPLVPGAIAAARAQVAPVTVPGVPAPDLRPTHPFAEAISVTAHAGIGARYGGGAAAVLSLALLLALAATARRRAPETWVRAIPVALLGIALTAGLRVHLRTRNVLALPLVTLGVASFALRGRDPA